MKAVILTEPGGVEKLQFDEIPKPIAADDEVVVKVKAISINPIDVKTRMGIGLYARLVSEVPIILGWDISGEIVEVGARVEEFKVGDEVFGMINFPGHGKAYAEYVTCKAEHLARKPRNISHTQAAASCLAALTAWQALTKVARLSKNDRILIHAAAGGVGHFAVQISKQIGAYVVATCSKENTDFVSSIGANEVIDYQTVNFEDKISELDFVLDAIGGDYIERSLKTLKMGGTYICLPSNKSAGVIEKSKATGKNGYTMLVESNGNDMKVIAQMLENNQIIPHLSSIYSFEEIQAAHRQIETGRTKGKIAVLL
ncbi:MAG: NADP-dependent oxidoreductase [Bacteroidales bacterium]|nr:NADP-dependent oxidoreductase [Bacteroidales bacterium]